jgi:hypothetical protein
MDFLSKFWKKSKSGSQKLTRKSSSSRSSQSKFTKNQIFNINISVNHLIHVFRKKGVLGGLNRYRHLVKPIAAVLGININFKAKSVNDLFVKDDIYKQYEKLFDDSFGPRITDEEDKALDALFGSAFYNFSYYIPCLCPIFYQRL